MALFITCSDSRTVPDMICQTQPGDLFVLRNAGNIVPPYTPGSPSGEAATIEFAIRGLGIRNIILCGHTRCGAMQAVSNPDSTANMPRVRQWLEHAQASAEIVCSCYQHLPFEVRWKVLTQENVLVQIENLRTHPAVAAAMAAGRTEAARVGLQDGDRRGVRLRPDVGAVQSARRERTGLANSYPITRTPGDARTLRRRSDAVQAGRPGSGTAGRRRLKLEQCWETDDGGTDTAASRWTEPRRVVERRARVARRLHGGAAALHRHRPGQRSAARGRHSSPALSAASSSA